MSMAMTEAPCSAASHAAESPATPAPTMTMSAARFQTTACALASLGASAPSAAAPPAAAPLARNDRRLTLDDSFASLAMMSSRCECLRVPIAVSRPRYLFWCRHYRSNPRPLLPPNHQSVAQFSLPPPPTRGGRSRRSCEAAYADRVGGLVRV